MFNNIGGKIKGVALLITCLGIAASIILFMALVWDEDTIILAFVVLIVGCVVSWLSSLTLYGLGQLIENSDIIAGKMPVKDMNESGQFNLQAEESKKTASYDSRSFDELIDDMDLTAKQRMDIKKIIDLKNDGLITANDCRNRITNLLSDIPLDWVILLLNKI